MNTIDFVKQAFDLKEQKYYKPAIEMLYKALETEQDNEEILYQIGELYFLMNNYSRALQYLEKILLNNENNVPSLKVVFQIKMREENYAEAIDIALKLFENQKNSENLKNILNVLIKQKDFDKVKEYFNNEFFDNEIKLYCANSLYNYNFKDLTNKLLDSYSEKDN